MLVKLPGPQQLVTDIDTTDKRQCACLPVKSLYQVIFLHHAWLFYHVHITVYNTLKYWSLVLTAIIMYFLLIMKTMEVPCINTSIGLQSQKKKVGIFGEIT